MQSIQAVQSKENIPGARYLASHSQHALCGYCTTAVPGTSTKPTLSLPLLELNKASPPPCAQDYKAPQTPAGSHRGPRVALLLLARIRGAAVTSDRAPQGAKLPPARSATLSAALWNVLRSPEWAQGRDVGQGVTAHIPPLWISQPCSPLSSWAQTGSLQKSWYPTFWLQFWINSCPLMPTRSSWAAQVSPQAKEHQQPPFFLLHTQ